MRNSIQSVSFTPTALRNLFIWSLVFLGLVYLVLIPSEMTGPIDPILLTILLILLLLTNTGETSSSKYQRMAKIGGWDRRTNNQNNCKA